MPTPAPDDRLPEWMRQDVRPAAAPAVDEPVDDEWLAQREAEIAAREDRVARHGYPNEAIRAQMLARGALAAGARARPRLAPSWTAMTTTAQAREELRARMWEPKEG